MGARVEFQEDMYKSILRIPFLRNFTQQKKKGEGYVPCDIVFSIQKINEYMGYEYVKGHDVMTSDSINGILEEAEKRGDL